MNGSDVVGLIYTPKDRPGLGICALKPGQSININLDLAVEIIEWEIVATQV
jgi:hypothetical protein